MNVADRITVEAGKMGGRPCVRGLRIRVTDVLDLLASGMSQEEILADYPSLEPEDFAAVLTYASKELDHPVLAAE
jgi:uncharacterized protein (DUF433 family)